MKRSQQYREQIASKLDEVSAINAICAKDNREPTADETAIVNAAIGEDGQGGEVKSLKARLAQSEAFEAEVANQAAIRNPANVYHVGGSNDADSGSIFARVKMPPSARRGGVTAFKGPHAEQAAYGFGRMVLAACGRESSNNWCRDTFGIDVRNAMSSGSDSDGGFLVPAEYAAEIIRLVNEYGVARGVCQIVPMTRDTLSQPKRSGGITAYAIGEIGTPTASSPTLDQVQLVAKMFGALAYYSNTLDEDAAASVGNLIAQEMALGFAYKEDSCLFNGDGGSTYNGIVGIKESLAAGATYTALAGNTGFKTLDLDDFEGMVATLPSYAFQNGGPQWYIHRSAWAVSMLRLAVAAGGNTTREIAGGLQTQFLGYPVNFVEVMNSTLTAQTSTEGLCYFGNLRQGVMFGDRRGLSVAQSKEVQFLTQQTTVLGTERFDINVHEDGTASACGSIVMLATPGS